MSFYQTITMISILLTSVYGQQPADKGASAKTKETLDFIVGLPKQNKYLSGQFAGQSGVSFSLNKIYSIIRLSNQTPAIIGCDYANGWGETTPPQSLIGYTCNGILKDYSAKHVLITIDTHFPNPVSPNGGCLKNRSGLIFTDLLKPETETGQRWRSYLDIVAEGLNDLQQANVTVLYRPFHEMNGGWFWWGQQDPSEYKQVWTSVFNYFCTEKNLHNLLWVYAPDQSAPNVTLYYPGDDYVDIVALDVYVDDPTQMKGYDEITKLNKPFALGEIGPRTLDHKFDYGLWPPAIQNHFNLTAYFLAWGGICAPDQNQNTSVLYHSPHIVNRESSSHLIFILFNNTVQIRT